MDEKVVVTGGAGFVGSHLVHELVERGYSVTVLDNLLRGREVYLKDLIESDRIRFVKGDVRDPFLVSDVMKGAKYLVHKAAVCINFSVADPVESFNVNIDGTYNVLRAAHDEKVRKVVFASSASVYGDPERLPMAEDSPLRPITPYCIAKIAGENMLRMKGLENLHYVAFRYFNIYGARQSTDAYYTSVIIMFAKRLRANIPPQIMGDGTQSMDFVNVKDVVDVDIKAMESDVEGDVFNVGSGSSTSINEIARLMLKLSGKNLEPQYLPGSRSIVQRRMADITKVSKALGFKPKISLEQGLSELVTDIEKNPDYY